MGVRDQIDRDAVDRQRQISAVVRVESTQKILIRLAPARVLDHEQTGCDAQDVLHTSDGTQIEDAFLHGEGRGGADGPRSSHHGRAIRGGLLHELVGQCRQGRGGCDRRGRRREVELVGEFDRGGNGDAVTLGGLELELADCFERRFVKALSGRRRHFGVEHAPLGVELQLHAHRSFLPAGQRLGRIDRLAAILEHGRGQNFVRSRGGKPAVHVVGGAHPARREQQCSQQDWQAGQPAWHRDSIA